VLEILKAVEEATGSPVHRKEVPRRAGDPPELVADPARAQKLLGWKATRSLRDIVTTAWNWMQKYEAR
jgi:UDP-glucose 4-epimerase